ncbi:putative nucleosome remodeling complex ATPase subunit (Snf2h) [Aspergillus affinis]|uniref:putative nucleosome remodeling complex ATPase subunit (Snf2h) n=1 Tax=Aspergillus affinis TaxID=1070780 RepID=UPI0022FEA2BE|nr:uncharacterized protein KD926_009699 [Aspergillus affinis]KAI9045285.1 hypothetical protein KD926_009699 [Aspergillus affinis]
MLHGTVEEREKIKAPIRREKISRKGSSSVADIVITSYETLISDIVWFQRAFVWRYEVLDEGHRIKNGHCKRAQMLARLRTDFKLVLTGSAERMDNSVEDFGSGASDATSSQPEPKAEKRKVRILDNILMKLRKCSIQPYLLNDAIPDDYEPGNRIIEASGKFAVLRKILVKHVRLDGGTPSAMRNLSMYLFQIDPRYMVFLVFIRAGGEGLNLISASTVLFLDEDWNPQVMKQAESRVHRMGQTQPVEIFCIQAKGTTEGQMSRRLVKKAYLAATITGNTELEPSISVKAIGLGDAFQHQTRWTTLRYSIWPFWRHGFQRCQASVPERFKHSVITMDEERAWIEKSARVGTNNFNGETVDTSGRSFSVYKETVPLNLFRAARRIGEERTVMIDGFAVSKDSILDSAPLSPGGKPFEKQEGRSSTAKISHELQADDAIEHKCFLTDASRLYDYVLGLYDLELTPLVAQQAQMDQYG